MENYNIVKYWNKRKNPSAKNIKLVTAKHVDYIRKQTAGCKKILDFGPGCGRTFSSYVDIKKVVGVDITEQHKEELFKKATEQGFDFELVCKKTEFSRLNFTDKYFDAAVVSEVLLHQTPDIIENIMRELVRVAKKVVVISWFENIKEYDNLGDYTPSKKNCFNYNYYEICKKNNWNIYVEKTFRRQIYFVYSDINIIKQEKS